MMETKIHSLVVLIFKNFDWFFFFFFFLFSFTFFPFCSQLSFQFAKVLVEFQTLLTGKHACLEGLKMTSNFISGLSEYPILTENEVFFLFFFLFFFSSFFS